MKEPKFKVGDRVWEVETGWTRVVNIGPDDETYVVFTENNDYTNDGYTCIGNLFPSLLTVAEAAEYRIPPPPKEPEECWINIYPGHRFYYTSKDAAEESIDINRIRCVHMREVEDETKTARGEG